MRSIKDSIYSRIYIYFEGDHESLDSLEKVIIIMGKNKGCCTIVPFFMGLFLFVRHKYLHQIAMELIKKT